ncbi:MAG: PIN domain-containing protein [Actinomycetota bacterium]|nr:PIN domain-containing protein [Actinomycetota bacterium]
MSHPDDLVAVLDANVLYPQWLRDVLLTLAAMGYFDPAWSDQIIDEMRRNVLSDHPEIDRRRFEDTTIAALRATFPDAWLGVPDELVTQMDNAPEDRHVLAAAVAAGAQLVVTANTSDFNSPRFVDTGQVAIEQPSVFLTTVLEDHPDLMASVLWHLATNRRSAGSIGDVLEQLDRNEALRPFVKLARTRLL